MDSTELSDGNVEMTIPIPKDSDGLLACECPDPNCSPGYFKVKPGTGLQGQDLQFCPYCRKAGTPRSFITAKQNSYALDVATAEVKKRLLATLSRSFGLDSSGRKQMGGGLVSIDVSLEPRSVSPVLPPAEEALRRDVRCPSCGLDQSVFGLATWCPDCGLDIFNWHVDGEIAVVQKMLSAVDARRRELGARIAARDVENALEDSVSIFEAVLKALVGRFEAGKNSDVGATPRGNPFQSPARAAEEFMTRTGIDIFVGFDAAQIGRLMTTFAKRHPIAHNLGIVDREYVRRARTGELEGREIPVSEEEISAVLMLMGAILRSTHDRVFP